MQKRARIHLEWSTIVALWTPAFRAELPKFWSTLVSAPEFCTIGPEEAFSAMRNVYCDHFGRRVGFGSSSL
jgi:hypothetical protein